MKLLYINWERKTNTMVTLLISQEVNDFLAWRANFDSLKYFRDENSFTEVAVYANVNNPDKIVLIMDAPNADVVESFFNSEVIKEGMKKGGVISNTEIKILNRIK